jgi:Protein of unknown function (DUF2934)
MSKAQRVKSNRSNLREVPRTDVALPPITHQDIAERAYALYLARGGGDGHDVEDWLVAELGLREEHLHNQKPRFKKPAPPRAKRAADN